MLAMSNQDISLILSRECTVFLSLLTSIFTGQLTAWEHEYVCAHSPHPLNAVLHKTAQRLNSHLKTYIVLRYRTVKPTMADCECGTLGEKTPDTLTLGGF